jgi:hypothetical protein
MVVVAAVGLSAATEPKRVVQDAGARFAITLPVTWDVRSPSGQMALQVTGPKQGQRLPDSVDIVARTLPAGVTNAQTCDEEAAWITQHLAHINVTTWRTGPTIIAGLPAYFHTYAWQTAAGENRWSLRVCLVRNGDGFVLTGTTANAPGLQVRAGVLRQIINSFRFVRAPAGTARRLRADRNMRQSSSTVVASSGALSSR